MIWDIFLFLEQIAPSEIHEIFYVFGPQLNTFMSVGIWLKYFRCKLLQFECCKVVVNLGMSSFVSDTS